MTLWSSTPACTWTTASQPNTWASPRTSSSGWWEAADWQPWKIIFYFLNCTWTPLEPHCFCRTSNRQSRVFCLRGRRRNSSSVFTRPMGCWRALASEDEASTRAVSKPRDRTQWPTQKLHNRTERLRHRANGQPEQHLQCAASFIPPLVTSAVSQVFSVVLVYRLIPEGAIKVLMEYDFTTSSESGNFSIQYPWVLWYFYAYWWSEGPFFVTSQMMICIRCWSSSA